MLGNIGYQEIIIIGIVVLVLFGSQKLNEFAKGAGQATKEFKKVKDEAKKAVEDQIKLQTAPLEEPLEEEKSKKKAMAKVDEPMGEEVEG